MSKQQLELKFDESQLETEESSTDFFCDVYDMYIEQGLPAHEALLSALTLESAIQGYDSLLRSLSEEDKEGN